MRRYFVGEIRLALRNYQSVKRGRRYDSNRNHRGATLRTTDDE